jgi:hypothetical protein
MEPLAIHKVSLFLLWDSARWTAGEMTRIDTLHKKWLKDREYRKAYKALEGEFARAAAIMKARNRGNPAASSNELSVRHRPRKRTIQ